MALAGADVPLTITAAEGGGTVESCSAVEAASSFTMAGMEPSEHTAVNRKHDSAPFSVNAWKRYGGKIELFKSFHPGLLGKRIVPTMDKLSR